MVYKTMRKSDPVSTFSGSENQNIRQNNTGDRTKKLDLNERMKEKGQDDLPSFIDNSS